MATESVSPKYLLPIEMVDEAHKRAAQARAVIECLSDAAGHLDCPEKVIPDVLWVVRDALDRLLDIASATASGEVR